MDSFHKFLKTTITLFGKINELSCHQISNKWIAPWSWIVMDRKCSTFWCFLNEILENFVDKYLTIDETILKIYIHNVQIHQHRQMCRKKINLFVDFIILYFQ